MNRRVLVIVGIAVIFLCGIFAYLIKPKEKIGAIPIKENSMDKSEIETIFNQAALLVSENKLLEAKALYKKIIASSSGSDFISIVQKNLEELNMKVLFSPILTPTDELYTVVPGDTLGQIAKRFDTTVELLMKSNSLENDFLIPDMKLKVSKAKFSVVVDKSQNFLALKSNEEVLKTYIVSTGKNNHTPAGNFKIASKLIDPPWRGIPSGDPRNILGSRWMGFAEPFKDYGIHGTTEPETIGQHVTRGCIRMLNKDVEELYSILPLGTEVIIVD